MYHTGLDRSDSVEVLERLPKLLTQLSRFCRNTCGKDIVSSWLIKMQAKVMLTLFRPITP